MYFVAPHMQNATEISYVGFISLKMRQLINMFFLFFCNYSRKSSCYCRRRMIVFNRYFLISMKMNALQISFSGGKTSQSVRRAGKRYTSPSG